MNKTELKNRLNSNATLNEKVKSILVDKRVHNSNVFCDFYVTYQASVARYCTVQINYMNGKFYSLKGEITRVMLNDYLEVLDEYTAFL